MSESINGLRYLWFIGDRNISVYNSLINDVPTYGHDITKVECINHAVKCSHSHTMSISNIESKNLNLIMLEKSA